MVSLKKTLKNILKPPPSGLEASLDPILKIAFQGVPSEFQKILRQHVIEEATKNTPPVDYRKALKMIRDPCFDTFREQTLNDMTNVLKKNLSPVGSPLDVDTTDKDKNDSLRYTYYNFATMVLYGIQGSFKDNYNFDKDGSLIGVKPAHFTRDGPRIEICLAKKGIFFTKKQQDEIDDTLNRQKQTEIKEIDKKCSTQDTASLNVLINADDNKEFKKILEYIRDSDDTPSLYKLSLAQKVIEEWPDRGTMARAKKVNTQDDLVASYSNKCVKTQTQQFLNQLRTSASSLDAAGTKKAKAQLAADIEAQLYGRAIDLVNGIGVDKYLITDATGLILQDVLSARAAKTYSSCGIIMSAESFNKLPDSDKKLVVDHYNSEKIKLPDGYVVAGGKRRRTKRKVLRKYASTRSRARKGP